ncbi:MAG: nitroreductase family protein [Candidatus Goldbacteria bacterium]|nr:nitroreductase family protein [Candidatus Goldiibacteriota bacterium]
MDFFETVKNRRSVRKYKAGVKITKEDLAKIAQAGCLAPSARSVNPWKFIILTERNRIDGLQKIIGNNGSFLTEASAAIVIICEDTKYYLEDGCAAAENMLLAATALNLGACWIAGDKKDYCEDILKYLAVPACFRLVCSIAVGVADEYPVKEKPKAQDVISWEKYQ